MNKLKEIEARVNAATPGPYSGMLRAWIAGEDFPSTVSRCDLEFLGKASEDIPYLLDQLKRAVEVISALIDNKEAECCYWQGPKEWVQCKPHSDASDFLQSLEGERDE